jgi:phosphatidylinositol-bisphosphatase
VFYQHLSFVGYSKTVIDHHDHQIKATLESNANRKGRSATKETYTLMSKSILGGIVLLVYTRDASITKQVVDVKIARAACGILGIMGNKGGVGVRLVLDDRDSTRDDEDESEEEEEDNSRASSVADVVKEKVVFTFVTAHLAAHDHGLKRRNLDYASIVSRLIFTHDQISSQYVPPVSVIAPRGSNEEGKQMYETSYLFFFGKHSPLLPRLC